MLPRREHVHRCVFSLLALSVILLEGCLPIPYVYPTVHSFPEVRVDEAEHAVKVFRADYIIHSGVYCEGVLGAHMPRFLPVQLTPIPLEADGTIAARRRLALVRGVITPLVDRTTEKPFTELRFYRRGYHLITRGSEEPDSVFKSLPWRKADTLSEQMRALDTLANPERIVSGSEAEGHRRSLLFIASEYEALAQRPDAQELQTELRQKAKELRRIANGQAPIPGRFIGF